ncbi:Cytochrome c [Noviherbaspirillum humi]|uniref:Cytochrome c n=1 Tax=Noviherbaspirillum humi TaxID=1688639 RepID=A0A239EWM9_9BURK|nr:cytochrome c peroxidase [Noviherbaspirillum humi]SNS48453.1 Cytochrome c [Noviherbaspirillum humi]
MTTSPNARPLMRAAISMLCLLLSACGGGSATQEVPARTSGTASAASTGDPAEKAAAPFVLVSANASGSHGTYSRAGFIDSANPFFKPIGNGRSCASCHDARDGWSLTPASVQARYLASNGADPLFLPLDGATSPQADVSSDEARRLAYRLLLEKGLIRIGMKVPAAADFELAGVDDPYRFAGDKELSLFRRPLPSTNLSFQSTVMWDGRETHLAPDSAQCMLNAARCYAGPAVDLALQANNAALGHAQAGAELSAADQAAIVAFESGLFTAQVFDAGARNLAGIGGRGGPLALAGVAYYFGINDLVDGDYRTRAPFTDKVMSLYSGWALANPPVDADVAPEDAARVAGARLAIARGQALFNQREMSIGGVKGLPGTLVRGSCATCHSAPEAGSHSVPLLLDIGVSDGARRTADLPLYTLKNKTTGEVLETTDPGAALASGRWSDIGKFKVPILRALAARPPYFHNGSAKDLREVVDFYNQRFQMHLSPQEIADLTAFLKAL